MLYEVITTRDMNWGRDYRSNSFKTVVEYQGEVIKEQILPLNTPVTVTIEDIQATVITSYSIHYTKLYDLQLKTL